MHLPRVDNSPLDPCRLFLFVQRSEKSQNREKGGNESIAINSLSCVCQSARS